MSPRRAPAFRIDVWPQPRLQLFIAALSCLAAVAACAALIAHFNRAWPSLALTPLAGWWAWRCASFAPRRLQWDGESWRYADSLLAPVLTRVRVQVVMDLGDWMLLRLQPAEAGLWRTSIYLPLARVALGAHWTALRATLYSAKVSEPPGP
ncbi:hypothetical protein HNP55_000882 [Paucibacter oligotrophus]|uniref:Toxin CptA n=1 Tax=Roseateles oligotrophus TaxID=1769250 RepID=A0A840LAI9_9BURK|nr:hypothetical protein [Roseateles oligotrophus]MBB4842387.1 hypothetical protein [Roseateles oligotrophus]